MRTLLSARGYRLLYFLAGNGVGVFIAEDEELAITEDFEDLRIRRVEDFLNSGVTI